ncbi:MAG: bifunctional hydroxymethylpyrimidine kinase/phosphomethylpyrimidine kinase [Deltaproteobacteria bacterium]|nr:bifunctional hydroxymethylpyrimidine kinase/phosphomethylpyrimidine kinase [Deltaproteobacteria bacterium]
MKPARVLTIAGSDSSGGAGIQADLKTITVLGGMGMSVVTALTAQNTHGVLGIYEVPPSFVEMQFDAVVGDIGVDAAKTGMLMTTEIAKTVARKIRQYDIDKVVVDPVMTAKGGTALFSGEVREVLLGELVPLALLVTPNIPEAEGMAGMEIHTVQEMMKAAEFLVRCGARNVLLKGGHLTGDAVDILYDGERFHTFSAERIRTKEIHGTGCILSAAIATALAQGKSVFEAVREAKLYITEAIKSMYDVGTGYGLISHKFR